MAAAALTLRERRTSAPSPSDWLAWSPAIVAASTSACRSCVSECSAARREGSEAGLRSPDFGCGQGVTASAQHCLCIDTCRRNSVQKLSISQLLCRQSASGYGGRFASTWRAGTGRLSRLPVDDRVRQRFTGGWRKVIPPRRAGTGGIPPPEHVRPEAAAAACGAERAPHGSGAAPFALAGDRARAVRALSGAQALAAQGEGADVA